MDRRTVDPMGEVGVRNSADDRDSPSRAVSRRVNSAAASGPAPVVRGPIVLALVVLAPVVPADCSVLRRSDGVGVPHPPPCRRLIERANSPMKGDVPLPPGRAVSAVDRNGEGERLPVDRRTASKVFWRRRATVAGPKAMVRESGRTRDGVTVAGKVVVERVVAGDARGVECSTERRTSFGPT